jgi:hypothetical protein
MHYDVIEIDYCHEKISRINNGKKREDKFKV